MSSVLRKLQSFLRFYVSAYTIRAWKHPKISPETSKPTKDPLRSLLGRHPRTTQEAPKRHPRGSRCGLLDYGEFTRCNRQASVHDSDEIHAAFEVSRKLPLLPSGIVYYCYLIQKLTTQIVDVHGQFG